MAYTLNNIKHCPFKGLDYSRVTSDFGSREFWNPVTKKWEKNFHRGIDLTSGDTIVATARGKVTACRNTIEGYTEKYSSGNYVTLYHGNNTYTIYCHMKKGSVKVKVGDIVEIGQELGTKGSTGWSTGPHLHYGVNTKGAYVDPKPYLLGEKELPQYGEPKPEPTPKPTPTPTPVEEFKIGDKVNCKGYVTAASDGSGSRTLDQDGEVRYITLIKEGAKRPYHISKGNKIHSGDRGWASKDQLSHL